MKAIVRSSSTPDATPIVQPLIRELDSHFQRAQLQSSFEGDAPVLFDLAVFDPEYGGIPDGVKTRSGELFVTTNVPYLNFMTASASAQMRLLLQALTNAIHVLSARIPPARKEFLLNAVRETALELAPDYQLVSDVVPTEHMSESLEPEKDQIVLQWTFPWDEFWEVGDNEVDVISGLEDRIEFAADGAYEVDGHDFGSGTVNIFLHSSDTKAALSKVVRLLNAGQIPKGLRIGISGKAGYVPVYPEGLAKFDLLAPS